MEYDAVVIGAGHNGLTLAAYLRRAGLSTVVVEGRESVGGMSRTEEPVLPGFLHHPHANFLNYLDIMPMVGGLRLAGWGVRTVVPEVQHGIAFSDGRPGIVLHRRDHLDRTRASISRYSAADADVFVEMKRRARTLTATLARTIYRPPGPSTLAEQLAAIEAAYADLGITSNLGNGTAKSLIDALFQAPEIRALLYLLATEYGVRLDETGGDVSFLGFVLWMICARALPLGGMQTVADALSRAATSAGADVLLGTKVDRIVVTGDRASRVRLADRREIQARKLVASTAGLGQTLLGLVGPGALDRGAAREVEAFLRQPAPSMTSQHLCLRTPPAYRSARFEPDLDRSAHTFIGFDTPEYVLDNLRSVDTGLLPAPGGSVYVNTTYDPAQAPDGCSTAGVNSLFPPPESLSAGEKESIRESYNDALLGRWSEYAPNMGRDNVLGEHFSAFADSDRKIFLRHDQYRTGIEGLYLCGASTYPGGGVHGACAHNAFSAIASDLGMVREPGQGALAF